MSHRTSIRQRSRIAIGLGSIAVVVGLLVLFLNRVPVPRTGERSEGRGDAAGLRGSEVDEMDADIVVAWRDEPDHFTQLRRRMLNEDIAGRDVTDEAVLRAMGRVPRQEFVPDDSRDAAYQDHPLSIGEGQTISQPYIVALMTQLAGARRGCRALDVGTGSGYQAAVLAEICDEVCSIEIVEPLARQATARLAALGYPNVVVRHGDGYRGWPDKAPFDVIIVAAAPDHVPEPLVEQLAKGGRLVIPVGRSYQELLVIERDQQGRLHEHPGIPVRFVPMTGEAEKPERPAGHSH